MRKMIKQTDSIKAGLIRAREITKQYAKTFYFASRFLSEDKKYPAYSIYSVCRITDELVDGAGMTTSTDSLIKLKEQINSVYSDEKLNDELLMTFKYVVQRYDIPKHYFQQLIDGMNMDLNKNRYENFNELYDYCFKVAGVVGLIILQTFGYKDPQAKQYAVNLGVAMQLTNIIRDIKEDSQRGRIYLPQEEMSRFGVNENQISRDKLDDNFINLLKFQIKRARQFYASSTPGIKMIADLRSRFVVCLIKDLYSRILDEVETNGYDIFSRRAHVNTAKKMAFALGVLIRGNYIH